MQQFSEQEIAHIYQTTSFTELATIVKKALTKTNTPLVELCGPLTTGGAGSYEKNMQVYKQAATYLEQHEVHVFDLVSIEKQIVKLVNEYEDNTIAQKELLNNFFLELFSSGNIHQAYFLPGWRSSNGASWEHEQCKKLGIQTIEMPADWNQRTDYIK